MLNHRQLIVIRLTPTRHSVIIMSMKKHTFIASAALLVVLGLGTLGSGYLPAQQVVSRPLQAAHFLRHGASTNWSGYAVETNLQSPQSNSVNSVQGKWVIPSVTCSKFKNTYSSVWVGIDGYSDSTVQQTGTEQDCSRGRPSYYAWYEMYPMSSHKVSLTVNPGDIMSASVAFAGNSSYTLTLLDTSNGQSYTTTQLLAGTQRQSAEWVVEAPSSWSGVLPLANFGTAFLSGSGANLNGHSGTISDSSWQNDPITMVTTGGIPKAIPSALSSDGSSFSVTWYHN